MAWCLMRQAAQLNIITLLLEVCKSRLKIRDLSEELEQMIERLNDAKNNTAVQCFFIGKLQDTNTNSQSRRRNGGEVLEILIQFFNSNLRGDSMANYLRPQATMTFSLLNFRQIFILLISNPGVIPRSWSVGTTSTPSFNIHYVDTLHSSPQATCCNSE